MSDIFDWYPQILSFNDDRLVDAYSEAGRPIDELAYTEDFEAICRAVIDGPVDDARRHYLFKRLMTLRKMGQLPRTSSLRRR